jgi:hypothetical protein
MEDKLHGMPVIFGGNGFYFYIAFKVREAYHLGTRLFCLHPIIRWYAFQHFSTAVVR